MTTDTTHYSDDLNKLLARGRRALEAERQDEQRRRDEAERAKREAFDDAWNAVRWALECDVWARALLPYLQVPEYVPVRPIEEQLPGGPAIRDTYSAYLEIPALHALRATMQAQRVQGKLQHYRLWETATFSVGDRCFDLDELDLALAYAQSIVVENARRDAEINAMIHADVTVQPADFFTEPDHEE